MALKQAYMVQEALLRADCQLKTEIVILRTKGDTIKNKPFAEIGEKGIFVSEFEQALQDGQIDLAVHSAKDLPITLAEGLSIAAVLERADVRDVLIVHKESKWPLIHTESFVIGSSSRRRQLQAKQLWNFVCCKDIRGNVDSRLRKLKEGSYDGILLAKAGLDRLGVEEQHEKELKFYPLPPTQFLPAACQGIIAVETVQDSLVTTLCKKITDVDTELCFLVEREVLFWLAADCSEAAAAWCRKEKNELILDVMYAGKRQKCTCTANIQDGLEMAREAAKLVLCKA